MILSLSNCDSCSYCLQKWRVYLSSCFVSDSAHSNKHWLPVLFSMKNDIKRLLMAVPTSSSFKVFKKNFKIRLPLLPSKYLKRISKSLPILEDDPVCKELFDEAFSYHLFVQDHSKNIEKISCVKICPRKSYAGAIFYLGGEVDINKLSHKIQVYSWMQEQWIKILPFKLDLKHFGCVYLRKRLYFIGDVKNHFSLSTVKALNMVNGHFYKRPPMSMARNRFGVCTIRSCIYAVGGMCGDQSYSVVERLNLQIDTNFEKDTIPQDDTIPLKDMNFQERMKWNTVASMQKCKGQVAVAVFKNRIYALGGNVTHKALNLERTNTAESCSDDRSVAEQRSKREGVDTESVHNVMPSAGK
ncbi:kelch-like protein 5 [Trichonephila clavipes]|nr:kelch-like protein 5 [Trichonephila clavipes]